MSQVGRLMPMLHLYDNFFTLTKHFCKEQRQDVLAPILLVGMAAFRYLAHVIFLREQSLLWVAELCRSCKYQFEIMSTKYLLPFIINFFHVSTLKTLSDSIVLIITGKYGLQAKSFCCKTFPMIHPFLTFLSSAV